jgi:hypothetical protein
MYMFKPRNKEPQTGSIMRSSILLLLSLVAILAFAFKFLLLSVVSVSAVIIIALWAPIKRKYLKQTNSPESKNEAKITPNIEANNKNQSFSDKVKYEKKKQKAILLFCFDFDNTIVQENTHNILTKHPEVIKNGGQVNDAKIAKALVTKLAFKFKAENELAETFKTIYKEGHNIAVLSYHSFPLVLKEVLKNLLVKAGIPTKELVMKGEDGKGRIYINASLPFNSQEYHMKFGKNEYIQDAIAKFGMNNAKVDAKDNVILVDDDIHNRELATQIVQVIEVDPQDPNYNTHLKKAREIVYDAQYEKTLDSELDKIISSDKDSM